jgi:outer membrane protein OmpA-like peptidoglycan-associated protein
MRVKHIVLPTFSMMALGAILSAYGCAAEVKVNKPPEPPPAVVEAPKPPEPPPPPPPPPPEPIKGADLRGAEIVLPGDIEFDTGLAILRPSSKSTQDVLSKLLKILQDNPSIKLRVEGHTDSVGAPAQNKALSDLRAKAVMAWLVSKGVDANRLIAVGCGQDTPLVPNTSAANMQKNRRVEFDVEEVNGKAPEGLTKACAPNMSQGMTAHPH